VVKMNNEFWFYEIKTALTPRACLREAIGQLLEYGFWPTTQEPSRFIVVGEGLIDEDGQEYLRRLKKRFSLPVVGTGSQFNRDKSTRPMRVSLVSDTEDEERFPENYE